MNKRDQINNLISSTKILYDLIPDINFDKESDPVSKYSLVKMLVEAKSREIFDALLKIKRTKTEPNLFEDETVYEESTSQVEENLNIIFTKLNALGIDLIYSKLEGEIDEFINKRISDEFAVVMDKLTLMSTSINGFSQNLKNLMERVYEIEKRDSENRMILARLDSEIRSLNDFTSGLKLYKTTVLNK